MAQVTFETNAQLDKLLVSDKAMEAKVRNIVRKVLQQAREITRSRVRGVSTKQAYLAVRKSVYKKILGGNINIAPTHHRSGSRAPLPPVYHKLEHTTNSKGNHRGGNRQPRSRRTEDLLTYTGVDRGFILRFLNTGTAERHNGSRRTGSIAPRSWFGMTSQDAIEQMAGEFDRLMDELIEKEFNTK